MTSGNLRNLRTRTAAQVCVALGAAVAAAAALAACGGGSTSISAVAAATPSATASLSRNAVYLDCLRQHGADIPTAFPSRGVFTARPTGPRPSGGFGGPGGGFFGQSQNPQMRAAMRACVSVRPTGGFGARGATQSAAFRNCMTQQGVTIPATRPTAFPTAPPTDRAARYLNGLSLSDPKVEAALRVCSPLLPSPGARASGTSSPTG
ncbi:hypothetical protein KGA66_05830 [Actinocrinis puniceicyclus]|uniref:Lipoprotein n=1 Tax=Actinocrinis puniceicyclus TaxID=977794 RepID=A0A8J8BA45_9ACTN|nr:hypothetical protein [Actinocrinis puniceicyclus]MBS2962557.1 hypothetical protein [Actinocrinis puniceicyclus]